LKLKNIVLALLSFTLLIACGQNNNEENANSDSGNKVVVQEVIQGSGYTYINGISGGKEIWMATTKRPVEEGAVIYYGVAMEMQNFTSKDLDRTFESILFVQEISDKPILEGDKSEAIGNGRVKTDEQKDISIEKVKDGITLKELFENKEKYSGKIVKVKGQSVKVNNGIMSKNWVHIQDGTKSTENYDLMVTTNESINLNDVVVFEGIIILDKDFGYGYKYDLIMEDAKVVK